MGLVPFYSTLEAAKIFAPSNIIGHGKQGTYHTVKQENCAVVLLYVLMDDTPTIDVMWIFFVPFFSRFFVYRCAEFFIVR